MARHGSHGHRRDGVTSACPESNLASPCCRRPRKFKSDLDAPPPPSLVLDTFSGGELPGREVALESSPAPWLA